MCSVHSTTAGDSTTNIVFIGRTIMYYTERKHMMNKQTNLYSWKQTVILWGNWAFDRDINKNNIGVAVKCFQDH